MGFFDVMMFRPVRKKGKNKAAGEMGFLRSPGLLGRCLPRTWGRFPQLWLSCYSGLDPASLWGAGLNTVGWFAASLVSAHYMPVADSPPTPGVMRKIVSRIANYPLGGGWRGRGKLTLVESHCPRDSQQGEVRCLSSGCYNQKPLPVWLNQQAFVSHSFRGWKPKMEALAHWVPGVPGL